MKKVLTTLFAIGVSMSIWAQKEAKWLQYPTISPDGKTIAFSYMGNIYKVPASGGKAIPLTVSSHYDMRPVWSHDGQTIAFASDRYGNFDVYTIAAEGGIPRRISFHSANDYPYDFTVDNAQVLFGSGRNAPAASVRFPGTRYFNNLYTVPVEGGRTLLLTAAGAEEAHYNADGSQLVFQDRKGYEDPYRKHHTSAVTRDIWIYNVADDTYEQISKFEGENRMPVFSKDGNSVYYLNEKDGTQNVYKQSLSAHTETQLTTFKDFPVRHLSIADDGMLSFTWKGALYTMKDGGAPTKVNVQVTTDAGYQVLERKGISSVTEFAVNPNGKEIAFVNRGEVFVTGVDDSRTKRITNTPQQERMITWSPDGKSLLYSGEIEGSWDVYEVKLNRPEETYFYAATTLDIKPIIATDAEEFQAEYSPDGKKIAFIEERNILKVLDVKSGKKTTILPEGRNYSYSDGDWGYHWSPDSQWLLVDDEKGYVFSQNTALIKADGSGKIQHPINSGFGEGGAKWALDGKMMTYVSSREGRKSLANQGSTEVDIFAAFFDQEAYDRFMLSKEEFSLLTEKEKKEEEEKQKKEEEESSKKKKNKKDKKKDEETTPLQLNLENLEYRKVKLTINSSSISDYVISEDASKVYYLASFEKGFDLWVTEPRTHETKILAKMGGSPSGIEVSDDGKSLFISNRGSLVKVDAESGKTESIKIDGDMEVDAAAERQYMFDHVYRQVKKKFYDPTIHGIDWDMYYTEYGKMLSHINNNYDFQVLLSEFLGELNASHTGGRFYPSSNGDKTASLGLLYDETYTGEGIKITEVLSGGVLDKASNSIAKGDVITKINGKTIPAGENWNQYLNNIEDKNTLLTIKSGAKTFEVTVKPEPLYVENNLMYRRWTNEMAAMVDSLSNGTLGYVHVKGMNDSSFRDVYENALGKNLEKKALVVDTRFNGGGWLHDDLNTFLSGDLYLQFAPQGHKVKGGEPMSRWTKPSIVVMSEGNYSDAFIFPYVYKQNGIGKLVGMPVAGTGTAVWWERLIDPSIVFGIPMIATIGAEGVPTENMELEPDVKVALPFNDFLNGDDPQLQTAVNELLKEVE
ncbi:C-terminal processing protease CtpA/Prc, contains a PDZ domain [Pustulibacterium marinum]|uniref:Tricorn protease homolog n=1 Tax=Pustulibacterium marinum TaxID=1224947 RepID=A0A1I7GN48_9FLAO|nr:S41 family peptidase [Pustulibacterium marinum]SFU49922.1 C-terminal processing protease CtpA/Prc, contains a PDZ domain [Pustulibacterium marinum]